MTSQRSALSCALVVAAATASLLSPTATAAPSSAPTASPANTASGSTEDFDGDGFRDIAIGAPSAQVGQARQAGQITVLYGSQSGAVTSRQQTLHQDSPGIPGDAEAGDRFGQRLTTGDLDNDGYTDLIVGAPGEDYFPPHDHNQGALAVIWGSAEGLTGEATPIDGAFIGARFGEQLATGDFDADGDTDLVVNNGTNGLRQLSGPFLRNGTSAGMKLVGGSQNTMYVDIASGDLNGDGLADLVTTTYTPLGQYNDGRSVLYALGTPQGLPLYPTPVINGFGNHVPGGDAVAVGDIDNDGKDEIVIGRGREALNDSTVPPGAVGGMISYVPGSAQGPRGDLVQNINLANSGLTFQPGDGLGSGISVGDIDGDGYGDVTAGVPGEDLPGVAGADQGSVVTLKGRSFGLNGIGARKFTQDTVGVPGEAESGDGFGRTTRLLDTDGDGKAELFVGVPAEGAGAGGVWVLDGTATGASAQGSVTFGPDAVGIPADSAGFGAGFTD
ncbi:FG-GAP-like repeat-containing protein [Streptomyces sp. NPDC020965]|uniref:FG-GAP-like repeat-containing protein n=1 Tax=Streptomyces sp. NPDC020965 TaxID=3365105 RepID=UPI0037984A9C